MKTIKVRNIKGCPVQVVVDKITHLTRNEEKGVTIIYLGETDKVATHITIEDINHLIESEN